MRTFLCCLLTLSLTAGAAIEIVGGGNTYLSVVELIIATVLLRFAILSVIEDERGRSKERGHEINPPAWRATPEPTKERDFTKYSDEQ